jgi:hypothetical protein
MGLAWLRQLGDQRASPQRQRASRSSRRTPQLAACRLRRCAGAVGPARYTAMRRWPASPRLGAEAFSPVYLIGPGLKISLGCADALEGAAAARGAAEAREGRGNGVMRVAASPRAIGRRRRHLVMELAAGLKACVGESGWATNAICAPVCPSKGAKLPGRMSPHSALAKCALLLERRFVANLLCGCPWRAPASTGAEVTRPAGNSAWPSRG